MPDPLPTYFQEARQRLNGELIERIELANGTCMDTQCGMCEAQNEILAQRIDNRGIATDQHERAVEALEGGVHPYEREEDGTTETTDERCERGLPGLDAPQDRGPRLAELQQENAPDNPEGTIPHIADILTHEQQLLAERAIREFGERRRRANREGESDRLVAGVSGESDLAGPYAGIDPGEATPSDPDPSVDPSYATTAAEWANTRTERELEPDGAVEDSSDSVFTSATLPCDCSDCAGRSRSATHTRLQRTARPQRDDRRTAAAARLP